MALGADTTSEDASTGANEAEHLVSMIGLFISGKFACEDNRQVRSEEYVLFRYHSLSAVSGFWNG